jgi:Fe-S cluster assembly protein SufD
MVEQLERTHSLVSNWREVKPLLDTYGPPSLQELRTESLRRFKLAGLPNHKAEEYKYTSLRAIDETQFKNGYGAIVSKADIRQTVLGKLDAITLAFVNGQYAPELSDVQRLPAGAMVLPLQEALEVDQDLVMRHLGKVATLDGKLGTTNDERFVWLNSAYLGEGAFVYLPANAICEDPIHLIFISKADHGPFAAFPRVLIVAEENSQARVVETYQGLQGPYLNCAVTEIYAAKHAHIEHTRLQNETTDAFHLATVQVTQEGRSVYTSSNIQLGGQVGRIDMNAFVDGEHAETWLNGVYLGSGDQVLDNHTRIDHAKPNCNSFEVYKGILTDRARGVFNGKIFVYEDAQKTDAKQTNQTLLLSPKATIDTKPQLEIFADDVKCTHGATIGQLSQDMLFYLRARGIPEQQARTLLVYAFAAAGLEKISVESVKQALEKELTRKLHTEDVA